MLLQVAYGLAGYRGQPRNFATALQQTQMHPLHRAAQQTSQLSFLNRSKIPGGTGDASRGPRSAPPTICWQNRLAVKCGDLRCICFEGRVPAVEEATLEHPLTACSALIDQAGGVSYSQHRCLCLLGVPSHSQGMKRKSQFDHTPAMKWAVLLAVLMFFVFANCRGRTFPPSHDA